MKKLKALLLAILFVAIPLFANGSTETTTAKDDGTITLKATWWGGQGRHEITQKLFDKYSELHPEIKFEGTPSNWDGYFGKLSTQAASGSMPDIVQMDYLYIATYANNNSLADLNTYVNSGILDVSGIEDTLLSSAEINGKLQGVVASTSIIAIPYNENVLKEAGIDVPTQDWTWDDFIAICKAVKDKTGKYGFGLIPGGDTNFFNYFVRQHGQSLFSEDKKSLGYSDDQIFVDWITMWKDLMDYGAIPTPDEYQAIEVAGTDSSPIVTDGAAFIQEWNNFPKKVASKNSAIKLLTPPTLEGGEAGLWMKPGMFFSISANSKHPEEAAAFISWVLNSEEANDIMMAERGTPSPAPVREYMSASGKLSDKEVEMFEYTDVAAKIAGPSLPPDPQGVAEVNTAYDEAVYSVLYGMSTPEKAAATFRTKANEILSRNN